MGIGFDLIYTIGAVATSPLWGYRLLRTGKWKSDWPARFGKVPSPAPHTDQPTLLIHAVSVGEVNAIKNLAAELIAQQPKLQLVISTTTNTGFARARQLYDNTHRVVRFPLDFTFAVKRFLDSIQPSAVATVELEVWPNFIQACAKRNIPVAVINGRLSEKSFVGYQRLRPIIGRIFRALTTVAAQSQVYAQRFAEMGVAPEKLRVLDSMKWDTAAITNTLDGADQLAQAMGIDRSLPLVVLGSTGEGEESILLDALLKQCDRHVQILIVPRKPERFNEVATLAKNITRRSSNQPGTGRLFLLDTMGELRQAYALADVVIVGRSFNGWGLSDPIEPIALGKPIIIGPAYHNFSQVVDAFVAGAGLLIADDPDQAATMTNDLLHDENKRDQLAKAGREVILTRQGASKSYARLLIQMLEQRENPPA